MVRRIIKKIKRSKTFLITAHVNVEGDALGSELAIYGMLKSLKKHAVVYNDDVTPSVYSFLPFHQNIRNHLVTRKFDVALVLDCSDSSRAGIVKDYLKNAQCIINIDHHVSNTGFGDVNWVDPKASSACQLVYELCRTIGIMDKNIATCLYTGIFTDTGGFTYSSVTSDVHKIVADLLRYRVDPQMIHQHLHSSSSRRDLEFIGRVVSSIKFAARDKVCWVSIDKWEEKEYDLSEVIFSIMRFSKDAEVFILLKKIAPHKIRVNFRSRFVVDVNGIAQFFGGGGHARASGTTIDGDLKNVEKKVISYVLRCVNEMHAR